MSRYLKSMKWARSIRGNKVSKDVSMTHLQLVDDALRLYVMVMCKNQEQKAIKKALKRLCGETGIEINERKWL
jgi:hypothetical protein